MIRFTPLSTYRLVFTEVLAAHAGFSKHAKKDFTIPVYKPLCTALLTGGISEYQALCSHPLFDHVLPQDWKSPALYSWVFLKGVADYYQLAACATI